MKRGLYKVGATLAAFFMIFLSVPVYAASLMTLSDTMSRLAVSVDSNHVIQFTTPSGVEAGQNFTITFPSDFSTTSVDYTDIDVADDGTQLTLAGTPSGTTWGAAFSGTGNRTLTVTSGTGTIAGTSVITVTIGTNATGGDQAINNPTTAGTKLITIGVDNVGTANDDSGSLAIAIADGAYNDQFTVSANVDPSITFTLNDNLVNLGTLSVGAVNTDTTNFTVNTNATSGYNVTATEDGNLRTATADINDVADGTVTAGSEEYGMSTSKSGQTFAQTSGNAATAIDGTAKQCASAAGPVSSDATTLTLHASVAGTTPAGAYTHTITLVATANF